MKKLGRMSTSKRLEKEKRAMQKKIDEALTEAGGRALEHASVSGTAGGTEQFALDLTSVGSNSPPPLREEDGIESPTSLSPTTRVAGTKPHSRNPLSPTVRSSEPSKKLARGVLVLDSLTSDDEQRAREERDHALRLQRELERARQLASTQPHKVSGMEAHDGKGRPRQKTEGDEHEETAFERESRLLNAAIERARAAKAQEMLELEAAHDGHETPLQRERRLLDAAIVREGTLSPRCSPGYPGYDVV